VLYFTALRHLDAATYSVLSQAKTAFTALFFVTILGRSLSRMQVSLGRCRFMVGCIRHSFPTPSPTRQIAALGVLMAGMAMVRLGPGGIAPGSPALVGVAAVLAASFFSALANVIYEKVGARMMRVTW